MGYDCCTLTELTEIVTAQDLYEIGPTTILSWRREGSS